MSNCIKSMNDHQFIILPLGCPLIENVTRENLTRKTLWDKT